MKQALVFWFTGLSGAGKTTVAEAVKERLEKQGLLVLILDGDDVRQRLHVNLGFSREDIETNNRLICDLCLEEQSQYDVIMVPIIAPFLKSRDEARSRLGYRFFEVSFCADLETVMNRDVKGLYAKAKRNEITNMIGYGDGEPYEQPESPDFVVDSTKDSPNESIDRFFNFVNAKVQENSYA